MPILPIAAFPGQPWSAFAPQQALELVTTFNLEEFDALNTDPEEDLAWGDVGTHVSAGTGIIKVMNRMPQSLDFGKFKYGGDRKYNSIDAVATRIGVNPFDLNFGFPMIWNEIGNGWQLMSEGEGSLMEFLGVNGLAADYVLAGRAWKCELLASLFYSGLYCTGSGLNITTPTALAYGGAPQGLAANGVALFTDGTGAATSIGTQHYANPTQNGSGRFKNVWSAFGSFSANYGASLVKMTQKPHPTLSNVKSGARVTDTFGPPSMYEKFWNMMVQTLTLQSVTEGGNLAAAAATNPLSDAMTRGLSQDNFIGTTFGPRTFWIVPQLEDHPYMVANPGKDMWINVSRTKPGKKPRPSWAQLASNSKTFTPVFRSYGPGDPRAMSERRMRFEGDLDGGVAGGVPGEIDMFFEV